jgi:transposase
MSQAEIARQLSVSEASVSHWKDLLQKYGAAGLEEHKASGRPPGLSEKDKKALLKKLQKGARAAGFETERWTQARVQQVIEREFGVTYHSNYISRLLHDLGWSVQKPETRAIERDEELIRAWLSQDWPRIKSLGGSAPTSCLKTNLAFPFRKLSAVRGRRKDIPPS